MTISGAAIIRNGVKLGFPFLESIRSILPLCDEFVIAVGDSNDGTREKITALNDPRIVIIDTVWDLKNRTGGTILSEQTNQALARCKGEWVFYLQSDEVVHEKDHSLIRAAVERAGEHPEADGVAFSYLHFYGSYFTVQPGRNWYQQEVRIIRNGRGIRSHGDAQGFRKNGAKIAAIPTRARIYHYGWARPPEIMMEKVKSFHQLWHDDHWIEENCGSKKAYEFFSDLGNLALYEGDHPAVMAGRITRDTVPFIAECRAEYLRSRDLRRMVRDSVRRLPFGSHKNFIPLRVRE
jgi:glycosyltransferase involved in cell wall biosynthesis